MRTLGIWGGGGGPSTAVNPLADNPDGVSGTETCACALASEGHALLYPRKAQTATPAL